MSDVETRTGAVGPYAWRRVGSGPPLLLLNGFAATGAEWDPAFLAALGGTHTVLSPDHRGMGASALGDERLTVAAMAADAIGLLDHLGLERVAVVGWSMGGFVAQAVAAAAPERVAALVLLATDPGPVAVRGDAEVWAELTDRSGSPREQASRLLRRLFPPALAAQVDRDVGEIVAAARADLDPAALDAQEMAVERWYAEGAPVPVGIRMLAAAGEEDEVVPAANVALLADRPLAWSARFPGAGHAFMAQVPGPLADLIDRFLRSG